MNRKNLVILLCFVFILTLFLSNVNAADSYSIFNSCSADKTVMKLSSLTNAHGAIYSNSDYNYYLCSSSTGTKSCSGTNTVLKLSTTANAHAEIPSLNNYENAVCFGDLACIGKANPSNSDLSDYPIKMLSLSSETNAHIGEYDYYDYKILCGGEGGGGTPPGPGGPGPIAVVGGYSGKWVDTSTSHPEINTLDVTGDELGTSVSKVGILIKDVNNAQESSSPTSTKTTAITAKLTAPTTPTTPESTPTTPDKTTINTPTDVGATPSSGETVYVRIYERDNFANTFNAVKKTTNTVANVNTKSFFVLIGNAVRSLFNPTGRATSNIYHYINVDTYIRTITGTMVNGEVYVEWTITEQDVLKAKSEDSYEFYFKANIDGEEKVFSQKILDVAVDWSNSPGPGGPGPSTIMGKNWLDSDQITQITEKTISWNDLTPLQGYTSNDKDEIFKFTGNLIIGDDILNYGESSGETSSKKNLVYMNASDIGVAPGTIVYFNVYEKDDSSEGGIDDNIRIGGEAIKVSVDANQNAVAPIFLSQMDIRRASSGDGMEFDGSIAKGIGEFYYEVIYFSDASGSNDPGQGTVVGEGILYLTITFPNYSPPCQDSDRGLNYFVKGTASSPEGSFTDSCMGSTQSGTTLLQEFACEGDNVIGVSYICDVSNPCVNGACGGKEEDSPANTTNYTTNNTNGTLYDVEGLWKNKEMTEEIFEINYDYGSENIAVLYVSNISEKTTSQEVTFRIWESDELISEGLMTGNAISDISSIGSVDSKTNSFQPNTSISYYDKTLIREVTVNINSNGEAFYIWDIHEDELKEGGPEEDNIYEFFFGMRLSSETKTFKNKILKVNVEEEPGPPGPGGDECDNVDYCSDHPTEEMCNAPCLGVIDNEVQLNSQVDCSNSSIDCTCAWVEDECSFVYNSKQKELGSCLYVAGEIIENCYNTGTLIMTYNAIWNWNGDNCYETKNECIDKIGNVFGVSCIDKDGCWRQTDSSYDTCKDYQETEECSPNTVIDPPSTSSEDKEWYTKIWFFILIIILIILLILLILWFLLKRRKKKSKKSKLFKNKNNLYNIMNYISNVKRKGVPNQKIVESLRRSGWTPEQIKYAMRKYSGKKKNKGFRIFNKKKQVK